EIFCHDRFPPATVVLLALYHNPTVATISAAGWPSMNGDWPTSSGWRGVMVGRGHDSTHGAWRTRRTDDEVPSEHPDIGPRTGRVSRQGGTLQPPEILLGRCHRSDDLVAAHPQPLSNYPGAGRAA